MDWVVRLRAALVVPEPKYDHFKHHLPRLKQDRELWSAIENGVAQAAIIIVDAERVAEQVRAAFEAEGREYGHDYRDEDLFEACAQGVIASTPVAYLPQELEKLQPSRQRPQGRARRSDGLSWPDSLVPESRYVPHLTPSSAYSPEEIVARLGGSLKKAEVFAARAHACFDVEALRDGGDATCNAFRSPLRRLIVQQVIATARNFDEEMPGTVELLEEIRGQMEQALSQQPFVGASRNRASVRELSSIAVDHLQGADIAAGWARETLELSDVYALARRYECVWLDGVRIK